MSLSSRSVSRRCFAGATAFLLLATACLTSQATQLTKPSASDRQVALQVTWMLKHEHLLRHPLDAEISQRCFKMFLQTLDPMKMYFYQSDYDQFAADRDRLADLVQQGDISFAYTVYNTFLERIAERVQMVNRILATPQDFTLDEELVTDKDAAAYAKTPDESYDRWRKRIKYDLLLLRAEKADAKTDKSEGKTPEQRLTKRYHSFAKRMQQTDAEELLEMYLTSLTMAFDPHTSYMSPSSVENFKIMMGLKLEGIGASLQGVDGYTVVKQIIPGGAAEKEGHLKVNDKIIAVGKGESGELVNVVNTKLNDVVKMIRGKPGTVVRLELTSLKDPKPHEIKITRATIELKNSEAQGEVFDVGRRADGRPYKIGVINLPSFYMDMDGARQGRDDYRSTTRDVHRILKDFNAKGVEAVVLDLRTNGGGSLTEAISLTGLFINEGPVVQVKDADDRVTPYLDPDPSIDWNGPLVVVVSKFSASASEIFAGAIQDYNRGLIVGDKATHGKGTVQSLLNLGEQLFRVANAPKMGELKITMQQFYRPGGDSTPAPRRRFGPRAAVAEHAPRRGQGQPGLSLALRPGAAAALQEVRPRRSPGGGAASPPFRRAVRRFAEVPEGPAEHRALPPAEGQEGGHPQRGQVPQGAPRAERRQGGGEGDQEAEREPLGHRSRFLPRRGVQHHHRLHEPGPGRKGELRSRSIIS